MDFAPRPIWEPVRRWLTHPEEFVPVGIDPVTGQPLLRAKAEIPHFKESAYDASATLHPNAGLPQDGTRAASRPVGGWDLHQAIPDTQDAILENLASQRGLSMDQLTGLLERLEAAGLIQRTY